MSIGLGGDIVTTLNYYVLGDPLNLLAVFVPVQFTEILYTVLVIVRFYLSGITFYLYCRYHGYESDRILPGTLIYVFSFYSICVSTMHPFFLNPLIYFPLVLLGADKIMRERKPLLFILSCALSAASNFYFFYMITILMVIYCIIRYLQYHLKEIKLGMLLKEIGGFAIYYLIAIMIAAPVFIPTAVAMMESSRVGKGNVPILYELLYYIKLPIAFFNASADHYAHLGYGAVAFLAVMLLFFRTKWRAKAGYKIAFLLGTLFLLFPFFGHVFNGFSYATNRWVWGYCFVVSLIVVEMFPEVVSLPRAGKWAAAGLTVLLAVPTFYFRAAGAREKLLYAMVILVIFTIVLAVIIWAGKYFKDGATVYLLLIIAGIFLSNFGFYSPLSGDNLQYYGSLASAWQEICEGPFSVLEGMGEEAYKKNVRIDTSNLSFGDLKINSAMLYDVNSTSCYYSVMNENMNKFLHELWIPTSYANLYMDLDSRAMLMAALGTGYDIVKPGDELYLPHNFDQMIQEQNGYVLFETDQVLPVVYLYDSMIKEQEYIALTPLQKQQAILQTAVVSESDLADCGMDLQMLNMDALTFGEQVQGCEVEETSGLTLKDHRIEVEQGGAFLTLRTNSSQEGERYFSFENLWYEGKEYADITITDGVRSRTMEVKSDLNRFYANIHHFLCNLGYASSHSDTWKIVFSEPGIYTFDSIEIIDQPLGDMKEWIADRRETQADYSFAEDRILVDVNAQKDGLLYVSVPHSKGWKVYVDGKEDKILKVNHFGMGIWLEQGEHKIAFMYHTPYLRIGIGLMILGIICCLIVVGRPICPYGVLQKEDLP